MFRIEGKIGPSNVQAFEQEILRELPSEIDASQLHYISSAGLRVLLRLAKAVGDVTIFDVNPEVYDILDMTGFTEILTVKKALREIDITGKEIIGRGGNGTVYRLDRDTIVKVFNPNKTLENISKSRETAQKVFLNDIPCAISYDVVKAGDRYGVVYEMIDAKTLGSTIHDDPGTADELTDKAANLLRKLHNTTFPHGSFPPATDFVKSWVDVARDFLTDEEQARIKGAVDRLPAPDTFLHCDFHTNNIMVQNGELILIDIDDAALGDPAIDFAGMFTIFEMTKKDAVCLSLTGMDVAEATAYWTRFKERYFAGMDADTVTGIMTRMAFIGSIKFIYGIAKTDITLPMPREEIIAPMKARILQMLDAGLLG